MQAGEAAAVIVLMEDIMRMHMFGALGAFITFGFRMMGRMAGAKP